MVSRFCGVSIKMVESFFCSSLHDLPWFYDRYITRTAYLKWMDLALCSCRIEKELSAENLPECILSLHENQDSSRGPREFERDAFPVCLDFSGDVQISTIPSLTRLSSQSLRLPPFASSPPASALRRDNSVPFDDHTYGVMTLQIIPS